MLNVLNLKRIFIMFFVIPQFDNYVIFFDIIGSDKVISLLETIKSLVLSVKGFALLKNPDSVLIMIAIMFYFIDLSTYLNIEKRKFIVETGITDCAVDGIFGTVEDRERYIVEKFLLDIKIINNKV